MLTADNDDDKSWRSTRPDEPDPHGQAALLLVESLIHELVAQSVISIDDAINVMTVAIDAKIEIAANLGESDGTRDRSLTLLSSIHTSLGSDALG